MGDNDNIGLYGIASDNEGIEVKKHVTFHKLCQSFTKSSF